MLKKLPCIAATIALLSIASCKKDSKEGDTNNPLVGNWTFVSTTAHTLYQETDVQGGVTDVDASTSDYTTIDNKGAVNFSGNTMTGTGVGYSVSSTVYENLYENGQLISSNSAPFHNTLPATNSASTYKLIGTDSLYFPQGGFAAFTGNAARQSLPAGAKFVINGNTLTMTMKDSVSQTQILSGITITVLEQVSGTTILQRK